MQILLCLDLSYSNLVSYEQGNAAFSGADGTTCESLHRRHPQMRPNMRSIVAAPMKLTSLNENWDVGSFYMEVVRRTSCLLDMPRQSDLKNKSPNPSSFGIAIMSAVS